MQSAATDRLRTCTSCSADKQKKREKGGKRDRETHRRVGWGESGRVRQSGRKRQGEKEGERNIEKLALVGNQMNHLNDMTEVRPILGDSIISHFVCGRWVPCNREAAEKLVYPSTRYPPVIHPSIYPSIHPSITLIFKFRHELASRTTIKGAPGLQSHE